MYQSRLVEVFRSLDKKELRGLEKFVKSPFFNQRDDVIALFEYLRKRYPFRNNKGLGREEIFRFLHPDAPYEEKNLGYTFSFLFKAIKSFLAWQEFNADPVAEQIALCRALRKKGVKRIFDSEIKLAEKMQQEQQLRNSKYHFQQYQILLERDELYLSEGRSETHNFQQYSNEFTYYYLANKLRYYCRGLLQKTIYKSDQKQLLLEEVIQHVESRDYSHIPAISLYYNSYKAFTEADSVPYFEKLRAQIKQQHHQFPKSEMRDLYVLTINYCIRQINAGQKDFLENLFAIYKDGLSNDVFIQNEVMSPFTYKNIVMTGLGLEEFNWVEEFLFAYKDKIKSEHRENTFNYNLANLYYRKPDYAKAMRLLQQVEFDDPLLNLNARRMLLTIYYTEKEYDALQSHLDSFKNYIYRHKELGYHRNLNLNLIRFTRKLLQLPPSRQAAQQLREEIINTKEIAEKHWLLEQLGNY